MVFRLRCTLPSADFTTALLPAALQVSPANAKEEADDVEEDFLPIIVNFFQLLNTQKK